MNIEELGLAIYEKTKLHPLNPSYNFGTLYEVSQNLNTSYPLVFMESEFNKNRVINYSNYTFYLNFLTQTEDLTNQDNKFDRLKAISDMDLFSESFYLLIKDIADFQIEFISSISIHDEYLDKITGVRCEFQIKIINKC